MNFVWLLLLTLFSFHSAARCDKYVSGYAWVHKIADTDEGGGYEGCKKGCYTNTTFFNDNGIRKCEKCSTIEDEANCTYYGATCRWTKGGKCVAQNCPNIAKNVNAGAYDVSQSYEGYDHGRVARFEECLNGSPREKYFNDLYIRDYRAKANNTYYGMTTGEGGNINCNQNAGITDCKYTCEPSTTYCGFNGTLDPTATSSTVGYDNHVCDDRVYPYPAQSVTSCRILPSIAKEICESNINSRLWYYHYVTNAGVTTYTWTNFYNDCLWDQNQKTDPYKTDPNDGSALNITDADYQALYHYSKAEFCNHEKELELKQCQDTYDGNGPTGVRACYGEQQILPVAHRDHGETVVSRAACHNIYGCMYSKSNSRCSVWSVWAFVLTLVIVILVVVGAGAAAVGVFVLRK